MLERIMEAIAVRSRVVTDQATMIERLEAQIKEATTEKDHAVADLRKVERLAKQSGDRMRERVQKLTAENKELAAANKKLENEAKKAAESLAVAEAEWQEMKAEHFDMTETLVAMEHRQAERQIELNEMTAQRDSLAETLSKAEDRLADTLEAIGNSLGVTDHDTVDKE